MDGFRGISSLRARLRAPGDKSGVHLYPLLMQASGLVAGMLLLVTCGRGGPGSARDWSQPEFVAEGDPAMRGAEEGEIPALHDPSMVTAEEADWFMLDSEPVIGVAPPGENPRAYSTWHLDSHEIVNDKLRSGPLLVTW